MVEISKGFLLVRPHTPLLEFVKKKKHSAQGLPFESRSLTEALAGSLLLELFPGRQRQRGFG